MGVCLVKMMCGNGAGENDKKNIKIRRLLGFRIKNRCEMGSCLVERRSAI